MHTEPTPRSRVNDDVTGQNEEKRKQRKTKEQRNPHPTVASIGRARVCEGVGGGKFELAFNQAAIKRVEKESTSVADCRPSDLSRAN